MKNLFLRKMKNTHEDTWYSFAECLKSISIEVLYVNGLTKNKQLLSAYLDGLIIGLNHNRHDKGNFLSYMRNSINYRQDYCSWHPYGKKSLKTKKIMEMVRNWSKETVPITGVWKDAKDIYVFFNTCTEIVNLCFNLVNLSSNYSNTRHNMFKCWPVKFLRLAKV